MLVPMCIDLVLSSSIDATNCLFTESDALRRSISSVAPVTNLRAACPQA